MHPIHGRTISAWQPPLSALRADPEHTRGRNQRAFGNLGSLGGGFDRSPWLRNAREMPAARTKNKRPHNQFLLRVYGIRVDVGPPSIPRGVRPSAPPTRLAELVCEPLPPSSVVVSRPFAAAPVESAVTHTDFRLTLVLSGLVIQQNGWLGGCCSYRNCWRRLTELHRRGESRSAQCA